MSPYFAVRPATLIPTIATLGCWVLLELVQGLRRRPGGVTRDRGSYFVVVLSLAAGWAITAFSVSIPGA